MFASLVLCWEPSLLRFCILNVHAHLQGILFAGMGGMVITMPPPGWACHLNVPSYPSMVTVVWEVVMGAPRDRVLSWGQLSIIPYTTVQFLLVVYLKFKWIILLITCIMNWKVCDHLHTFDLIITKGYVLQLWISESELLTHHTSLVTVSFWWDHGLVLYIASPLTLSHPPICLSLSSKIGNIRPSWVGPTFNNKLPPQLKHTL